MSTQVKYDYRGSVALITGAAQGMGFANAKLFADSGAAVVLADQNKQAVQIATDEIISTGGKALAVTCEVPYEQQVKELIEKSVAAFGKPDMAYYNAGINTLEIKWPI